MISEVRLLQAFNLFFGRPVPIEFRGVLQKLERNEERRLYRVARDRSPLRWEGRFVNARSRAGPIASRPPDRRRRRGPSATPRRSSRPNSRRASSPTLRTCCRSSRRRVRSRPTSSPTDVEGQTEPLRARRAERPSPCGTAASPSRSRSGPSPSSHARAATGSPSRRSRRVCGRLPRALLLTSGQDGIHRLDRARRPV